MFPHWHIPQISSEFFGVFAISIFPSVCRIHKMARLPPPLKELFSSSIMQIAITSWATTQIFKTFAAIAHCGSTCCTSALPIGQVLFSALPYLYFVRHGRVLSLYPLKPEDNQKGCFRTLACVLLSCASHPVEVTASVDIYPSRIVTFCFQGSCNSLLLALWQRLLAGRLSDPMELRRPSNISWLCF